MSEKFPGQEGKEMEIYVRDIVDELACYIAAGVTQTEEVGEDSFRAMLGGDEVRSRAEQRAIELNKLVEIEKNNTRPLGPAEKYDIDKFKQRVGELTLERERAKREP